MSEPLAPSSAMNSDTTTHSQLHTKAQSVVKPHSAKDRRPKRVGENAGKGHRAPEANVSWSEDGEQPTGTTPETAQERQVRQKHKAALAQVKDIFPSWPDLDVLELLEEVKGDSRIAIERIAEEVKRKEKKVVQEAGPSVKHSKDVQAAHVAHVAPNHSKHAHDASKPKHAQPNGDGKIPKGPREKSQKPVRERATHAVPTGPAATGDNATEAASQAAVPAATGSTWATAALPATEASSTQQEQLKESANEQRHVRKDRHKDKKEQWTAPTSKIRSWAQIARPVSPPPAIQHVTPPAPLAPQKPVPEKTILTNQKAKSPKVEAVPASNQTSPAEAVEPTPTQSLWAGTPAAPTASDTASSSAQYWKEPESTNQDSTSLGLRRGLGQYGASSAAVQFGSLNLQDALAPSSQQAQQVQTLNQLNHAPAQTQPQAQPQPHAHAQTQAQQIHPQTTYHEYRDAGVQQNQAQMQSVAQPIVPQPQEYNYPSQTHSQYQAPTQVPAQNMPQHNQEWANFYQGRAGGYDSYNYRSSAPVDDVERTQSATGSHASQSAQAAPQQHDTQGASYGQMQGYNPYGYYTYGMAPYYAPQYQHYPKQAYQPMYGQDKPYPNQPTTQQAPVPGAMGGPAGPVPAHMQQASQASQAAPVTAGQNHQSGGYGYSGLEYPSMNYDRGYDQKAYDDKYASGASGGQTGYQNYPYQSSSRYQHSYEGGLGGYEYSKGQSTAPVHSTATYASGYQPTGTTLTQASAQAAPSSTYNQSYQANYQSHEQQQQQQQPPYASGYGLY